MKRYIIIILITGMSMVLSTSCLKEYLDKAPESGLTEQEIFSKYDNFKLYFDAVYEGRKYFSGGWNDYNIKTAFPLYFNYWDQKYTWESLTDAADQGRYMEGQTFKGGNVSAFVNKFTYDGKRRPILESMFTDIRICNKALANMPLLEASGADPVEVNDLKAQAHFIRAFCHFELFRLWGPMPYLTRTLEPDDQWDVPRLSKHETLIQIALDFDSAATFYQAAGRMRRDNPLPGGPGHLASPDQKRPNGVAAKAYRGRALLYAASQLNNELGVTDWQNAAIANWEALQIALSNGYALMTAANRKTNCFGVDYTNEQLWAWAAGNQSGTSGNLAGIMNGVFGNSKSSFSGVCPTQNWVDKYETSFGEPLETDADRAAATAANHYKDQDPYKAGTRDPRFYTDIFFNQSSAANWGGSGVNKAQIYYSVTNGVTTYSELLDQSYLGITRTGYYEKKRLGEASSKNSGNVKYSDPLIRLAELYLNYAEAANEAYGPNTPAPGATLTAVQAINLIRARVAMIAVRPVYTTTTDAFRPRIKNERNIELSWEGHYYHDIRRWMDAPNAYTSVLIGMDIEKLPAGYNATTYPIGYRHTRKSLSLDRQIAWKEAMYYLPFNTEDNFKMKKFVPNVVW